MTLSIWRYSHLILAIISSLFILIASVTGAILAFEPISNQLQPYAVDGVQTVSLAEALPVLQQEYEEVFTLEVDKNDFVSASVITKEGNSETFYVNPFTGEKLGELIKKEPIFEFATNLHRSLFLKTTGRILIGVVSFLLFIIAITGVKLILKRQGGFKRFFSKVINENFEQYYHVVIGRYTLIPIIIITLTGVFLSLEKFDLLPDSKISHQYLDQVETKNTLDLNDFSAFQNIKLEDVKSVEFPFSDAIEDYFIVKLNDKELLINQYSGAVVSQQNTSFVALLSNWSIILHTGQGTIIWSIILLLASLAILFFMYSGFAMTLQRRKNKTKIKNKFKKDTAEYIILVGSETGNTLTSANLFYNALIKKGYSAYISTLNEYAHYNKAKHIIVFASTYGEGEAPSSASNFEQLFLKLNQKQTIQYSIVGFGSRLYPDYCKYAIEMEGLFQKQENFEEHLPLFKINNQSFEAFQTWIKHWNTVTGEELIINPPTAQHNVKNTREFKVLERTELNVDQTFLLRLRPLKKIKFQSGDLLAFTLNTMEVARQYSIAKLDGDVLLSIKKHENGLCSSYLSELNIGDKITAKVQQNKDFYLPKKAKELVLIGNGTGIAPFLGMINSNYSQLSMHLFWGGRTKKSLVLYSKFLDDALFKKKLSQFYVAYSNEQAEKIYVQDILAENALFLAQHLKKDGIIMICGSIAMQKSVLNKLNEITTKELNIPLSLFENNEQIKMDCY